MDTRASMPWCSWNHAQQFVGAVGVFHAAVGLQHRVVEGVALVGGADDGAAQVGNAAHHVRGQRHGAALRVVFGLPGCR